MLFERIHLKFLKLIFKLKRSTPSFMIYGELGLTPITIDIQARMVAYWSKLLDNEHSKINSTIYTVIYHIHTNGFYKSKYIEHIKSLLDKNGFSDIWLSQNVQNSKWLSKCFKQKLIDQYIQTWSNLVDSSSSGTNYRIFKDSFEMSKYIKMLPNYFTKILLNFKTRNHKLPIETGRWKSIPHSERKCALCNNDIGDEYHYIMSCKYFNENRNKFIKQYYTKYPNTLKFKQLFCESSKNQLVNLCHFINIINKECPVIYYVNICIQ